MLGGRFSKAFVDFKQIERWLIKYVACMCVYDGDSDFKGGVAYLRVRILLITLSSLSC